MENATSPRASSPRSDSVGKALARHRKALEEIRASNFESIPHLTNLNSCKHVNRVVFQDDDEVLQDEGIVNTNSMPYDTLWGLVTWKNPAATVMSVCAGSFAFAFLRNGSITTAFCYFLLSKVGWHVLRSMLSKGSYNSRLEGSPSLEKLSSTISACILSASRIHDFYIATSDTKRSVTVCACLWVLSVVGRYMDLLQLAYVAYLAAFVVPNIRSAHVTALLHEVAARIQLSTPAILDQMNTKQRRLSIAAVAASLWLAFDWSNRLVGLLMALLCVRMTMTQTEVEKLRDHAAPLTMSVKKKAARMSRRVSLYLGTAETEHY